MATNFQKIISVLFLEQHYEMKDWRLDAWFKDKSRPRKVRKEQWEALAVLTAFLEWLPLKQKMISPMLTSAVQKLVKQRSYGKVISGQLGYRYKHENAIRERLCLVSLPRLKEIAKEAGIDDAANSSKQRIIDWLIEGEYYTYAEKEAKQ